MSTPPHRPPRGLSSSSLRALDEWCPAALDYADAGAPADRSIFAVGTAAHAVMEALHEEARTCPGPISEARATAIGAGIVAALVTAGRGFDGVAEPPMRPEAASEGMALALLWLAACDGVLPRTTRPEIALAVDPEWRPTDYRDPEALWRGVLDAAGHDEGDEVGSVVGWTRDYKTAWTAGEDALSSLQLRGQTLLLLHCWESAGLPAQPYTVRREIANLRSHRVHSAEVDVELDAATLAQWRAEIAALVRVAPRRDPRTGRRPAAPGPGCARCPYRLACDAPPPEAVDLPSTAARWAALRAEASALEAVLREATAETPIPVQGGYLGWTRTSTATPTPDAGRTLARRWLGTDAPDEAVVGLVARLVTASGLRAAVRALLPRRTEAQQELLGELLTTRTGARWGLSIGESQTEGDG